MPFSEFVCGFKPCEFHGIGVEAQRHFSEAHRAEGYCLPPGLVKFMEDGKRNEARQGSALSPSMAGQCMREFVLARTLPYPVEPLGGWLAMQGTLFHAALRLFCADEWLCEVALPRQLDQSLEKVELWPGVWVSGTADILRNDYSELHDYKTAREWSKYSKALGRAVVTHFAPKDDHLLQVNVYGRMVERVTGKMPELGIWKVHLGSSDPREAIRFYPIETLDLDELREKVVEGTNGWRRFLEVMAEEDTSKRLELAGKMDLAGRTMYGGKKCTSYCGMEPPCTGLIPVEERW